MLSYQTPRSGLRRTGTRLFGNSARRCAALALFLSPLSVGDAGAEQAVSAALKMRVQLLTAGRELRVQGELIAARKLLPSSTGSAISGRRGQAQISRRSCSCSWREARLTALDPSDYHAEALRKMRAGGWIDPEIIADRDLLLSDALVRLVYHLHFGKTNPRDLYPRWSFSRTLGRIEPVQALEALLSSERLEESVERYAPQLSIYRHLREALAQHRAIEAEGGWGTVPADGTLRPGMRDTRVQALRARLATSGDLSAQATAEPELFDETVEAAVKGFQTRHGLEPDGAVGRRTAAGAQRRSCAAHRADPRKP